MRDLMGGVPLEDAVQFDGDPQRRPLERHGGRRERRASPPSLRRPPGAASSPRPAWSSSSRPAPRRKPIPQPKPKQADKNPGTEHERLIRFPSSAGVNVGRTRRVRPSCRWAHGVCGHLVGTRVLTTRRTALPPQSPYSDTREAEKQDNHTDGGPVFSPTVHWLP